MSVRYSVATLIARSAFEQTIPFTGTGLRMNRFCSRDRPMSAMMVLNESYSVCVGFVGVVDVLFVVWGPNESNVQSIMTSGICHVSRPKGWVGGWRDSLVTDVRTKWMTQSTFVLTKCFGCHGFWSSTQHGGYGRSAGWDKARNRGLRWMGTWCWAGLENLWPIGTGWVHYVPWRMQNSDHKHFHSTVDSIFTWRM